MLGRGEGFFGRKGGRLGGGGKGVRLLHVKLCVACGCPCEFVCFGYEFYYLPSSVQPAEMLSSSKRQRKTHLLSVYYS